MFYLGTFNFLGDGVACCWNEEGLEAGAVEVLDAGAGLVHSWAVAVVELKVAGLVLAGVVVELGRLIMGPVVVELRGKVVELSLVDDTMLLIVVVDSASRGAKASD